MTPAITINAGKHPTHPRLLWTGPTLSEAALSMMYGTDPHGEFSVNLKDPQDFVLTLGQSGSGISCTGADWNASLGDIAELQPVNADNPFGPALAAILAVSELFARGTSAQPKTVEMNAFDWRNCRAVQSDFPKCPDLGEIWFVGTGSVGSAALFFLSLVTVDYKAVLFDMDITQVENLDRSPIFLCTDVGVPKVKAAGNFLRKVGVTHIKEENCALDESSVWRNRQEGAPDLIVAAANERNVRYQIESACPPIQIYGTTGTNWQSNVLRHLPFEEGCSCCVFPPEESSAQTRCATAMREQNGTLERKPDAALPFLSFLAGLMTAVEITKLGIAGFPFSPALVSLQTRPGMRLVRSNIPARNSCYCEHRSPTVHQSMIDGSRYAHLSDVAYASSVCRGDRQTRMRNGALIQ